MTVVLVAAFYRKIIDTFDKLIINSYYSTENADDPTLFTLSSIGKGHFMFGVEIWHYDLNQGSRYFDVVLTNTVY